MKRTLCTGAALLVVAMTAGCGFKIFEDIGSDPHPPSVAITSINIYVEPETEETTTTADAAALRGKSAWDSGGLTLGVAKKYQIHLNYADSGADIESFHLRDRNSSTQVDITPSDNTYFSGTHGSLVAGDEGIELTGVAGRHRMELWAVDSHGSRSEKVEFDITLTL